eukprot:gene40744-biopygen27478
MGVPIDLGERRFLHPGPLRWLRASAWMVVLVVVTALIGYGVVIFAEKLLDPWGGPGKLVASVIGAAVTLALYAALVRLAEGRKADEIALHAAIPGILAVFFSPTRHHWKDKSGSWTKGNDVFLNAA